MKLAASKQAGLPTSRLSLNFRKTRMALPPYIQTRAEGVVLFLKVQPRAAKNAIGEVLGQELKVKVTAPPVDSAANEGLVEFLAETLSCPRNAIRIIRGQTSRHKQVLVTGMSVEAIVAALRT